MLKNRHNLVCPELVRYHYTKYAHLLKRYLLLKHQCKELAEAKVTKLLEVIDDSGPLRGFIEEITGYMDKMPHRVEFRKYCDTLLE